MSNILYTTPSCPKCKLAKQRLDAAGIEYSVCEDVPRAIAAGITSAPTLVMEDKKLNFQDIILMCKGAGSVV